jgi:hypothetical protein
MKSIPQKNDLVDVGGHIRLHAATGFVLGYGFATTLSSDGDSHTDFEIFRTTPVFDAVTGKVINSGPAATGGHTAMHFNTDGSIKYSGDFIVAIDYERGGSNPNATVRVWVNPRNLDSLGHDTAYINRQPNRPFVFTGKFDGGSLSGNYGYAEIRPVDNSPSSCLIALMTNRTTVIGPAWGSLSGNQAHYNDNITRLQMVEIGINLTAFGFGSGDASGEKCELFLGNLLVKTRSSSSFTAELKDYAGPYRFAIR